MNQPPLSATKKLTLTNLLVLLTIFLFVGASGGAVATLLTIALHFANHAHQVTVPWLPWLLPIAGLGLGLIFERAHLHPYTMDYAIEQIDGISNCPCPKRMGFWAFFGTAITHTFGGSAGREGAAIQSAVSLADWIYQKICRWWDNAVQHLTELPFPLRQEVLICAVAAGFAGTFHTPLGATIFAVEMIRPGEIRLRSVVPAAIGGFIGNTVPKLVTILFPNLPGLSHPTSPTLPFGGLSLAIIMKWILFGLAVAATVWLFIELTAIVKRSLRRWIPYAPLRMMLGGIAVILIWQAVDTSLYLGLGTAGIDAALAGETLPRFAFMIKLILTAITVGSGFPGGEVTPLFFIGSTLGSTLAGPLGLPMALATRVGMLGAFGAASNSPLGVVCMSLDLFGWSAVTPWLLVCSLITYFAVGSRSLYSSHVKYQKWLPTAFRNTDQ